jgi:hypothetical protein
MSEKLTPKHLEVLLNLAMNKEPMNYQKFLPDLNPVLDLIDYHLINKIGKSYELSVLGRESFNKILQYASKYFEKKMNSN